MDARIEAIRSHLNEYGDLLEADATFLLDEIDRLGTAVDQVDGAYRLSRQEVASLSTRIDAVRSLCDEWEGHGSQVWAFASEVRHALNGNSTKDGA